jgi:hypothetical protein
LWIDFAGSGWAQYSVRARSVTTGVVQTNVTATVRLHSATMLATVRKCVWGGSLIVVLADGLYE